MTKYHEYIPRKGWREWLPDKIKELGEEKMRNHIYFIFKQLYMLQPGQSKTLDSFGTVNKQREFIPIKDKQMLVRICALAVEESQSAPLWKEYDFVFSNDYKSIMRLQTSKEERDSFFTKHMENLLKQNGQEEKTEY